MQSPRALAALLAPALVVAAASLAAPPVAHAGPCAYASGWSAPDRSAADRVIVLVNEHRAKIGVPVLGKASVLAKAAEWKSGHMAARGYFSHEDQGIDGGSRSVGDRLADCGYRGGGWAENIALGQRTPAEVVRGWLDSPGHRQNIESSRLRSIGVGVVANASGRIYWTQMFGDASVIDGRGGAGGPAPKPAPTPPAGPGDTGNLPALRSGVTLAARPHVRARRTTWMRFAMPAARRVRIVVRSRSARGRRAYAIRLHCNGKRVASARGRRGKAAVIARRIPRGRCALMVKAGKAGAPVAATLRAG